MLQLLVLDYVNFNLMHKQQKGWEKSMVIDSN